MNILFIKEKCNVKKINYLSDNLSKEKKIYNNNKKLNIEK